MLNNRWKQIRLGEIAKISSGTTPSRSREDYWNGNIPWVTTGEIDYNDIVDTREKITQQGLAAASLKLFPSETILMAMIGQGATRGRVAKLKIQAAINQNCCALIPSQDISSDFLYYYLESQYQQIRDLSNAGGQQNLNNELIRSILIPLIPPVEQHRIVEVLSTWDRAIDLTTQLIAAKQQRKHGLMQQLLTGKKLFPGSSGWSKRKIGDLFRSITRFETWDDEKTYTQAIVKRWSQGIEVRSSLLGKQIKTKNLQVVRVGDFLISDIQASYGAMSLVGEQHDGLYVSNVYTILVPQDENQIYTPYFDQLSRTPLMSHLVVQSSNGFKAERIRLGFVLNTFLQQQIYLPDDVSEQRRIADLLQLCDNELALLNRKLALLKKQKQGLMQQLLTGRIQVKT